MSHLLFFTCIAILITTCNAIVCQDILIGSSCSTSCYEKFFCSSLNNSTSTNSSFIPQCLQNNSALISIYSGPDCTTHVVDMVYAVPVTNTSCLVSTEFYCKSNATIPTPTSTTSTSPNIGYHSVVIPAESIQTFQIPNTTLQSSKVSVKSFLNGTLVAGNNANPDSLIDIGFLLFNVSTLLPRSTIISATVMVWPQAFLNQTRLPSTTNATNGTDSALPMREISIHAVDTGLNLENFQISFGPTLAYATVTDPWNGGPITFTNVDLVVSNWVNGLQTNYGFVLCMNAVNDNSTFPNVNFATQNTTTADNMTVFEPQLSVFYQTPLFTSSTSSSYHSNTTFPFLPTSTTSSTPYGSSSTSTQTAAAGYVYVRQDLTFTPYLANPTRITGFIAEAVQAGLKIDDPNDVVVEKGPSDQASSTSFNISILILTGNVNAAVLGKNLQAYVQTHDFKDRLATTTLMGIGWEPSTISLAGDYQITHSTAVNNNNNNPPSTPPGSTNNSSYSTGAVVAGCVILALIVIALIAAIFMMRQRQRRTVPTRRYRDLQKNLAFDGDQAHNPFAIEEPDSEL